MIKVVERKMFGSGQNRSVEKVTLLFSPLLIFQSGQATCCHRAVAPESIGDLKVLSCSSLYSSEHVRWIKLDTTIRHGIKLVFLWLKLII